MNSTFTSTSTSTSASTAPGRVCPLRYRYGARAIADAPVRTTDTLYVIGGLYGNLSALNTIEAMMRAEPTGATLCFNGDFNWFNVADAPFAEVNTRVLRHDAIVGNVEAEFDTHDAGDEAGCGCAYPDSVDVGTVERSNQIHAQLKATARRHPALLTHIARLPMFARYQVGTCRIAVVHGDADSLAGWRFGVDALRERAADAWLQSSFAQARVDAFCSSHTCLPALHRVARPPLAHAGAHAAATTGASAAATTDAAAAAAAGHSAIVGYVANNGAAGMPNFAPDPSHEIGGYAHQFGLLTRVGLTPSPHETVAEVQHANAFISLLPIRYDAAEWTAQFLAQWPVGSAAHQSYFQRITEGTTFAKGHLSAP